MSELPERIQKKVNELGALTHAFLSNQVPQPGQNPYATGVLKRSLKVSYFRSGESIGWRFSYLDYGAYTNLGTKQYNKIKFGSKKANPWELPPFRGYVKGEGGIQAQYWMTLSETTLLKKFKEDIKDEIKSYLKKKMKK